MHDSSLEQIPTILNLSDITQKFHTAVIFVIINMQIICLAKFIIVIICVCTQFYVHGLSVISFILLKPDCKFWYDRNFSVLGDGKLKCTEVEWHLESLCSCQV